MIRRKRNILEMAVATAIFTACAAAAMPVSQAAQAASSASAASDNGSQATSDTAASSDTTTSSDTTDKSKNKKQVANENMLQPVVISGFVSSLENSIAVEKNSDEIGQVISSQEIGELPGTSIADALSRVPGLAVQEYNGRPQQLRIHGLSSDFDVTDIDGSILPSTSNNRDVELNQYPASWFDQIDVEESPKADLINAGIAGTVDMHTMQPLSQKGTVATLNANYQWNNLGPVMPGPGVSNHGYDINGIFANQFFDRTFGVALGIDLEDNPAHIYHQAPWGYANDANGNLIIGGSKNYNISDLLKRDAYLATFEFRPSSALHSTLNLLYEKYNETQQDKGAEVPLAYGSNEVEIPSTTVNGFDQTGTFDDVYPVIRNDYTNYDDYTYNVLWNNTLKFSSDWIGTLNAAYSRAESSDVFAEAYSGYGYDGPANESTITGTNMNFNEGANGELYLNSSQPLDENVMLTDPQGWGAGANLVQAGFINAPHTEDYIGHVTLGATKFFDSGPFSALEFGVDHQRHRKDYLIEQDFLVLGGGPSLLLNQGATRTAPIPTSAIEGTVDALGFMGLGPEILYNPFALIADGTLVEYPTALSSIATPPDWIINENDTTGYLQLNINTDLGADVGLKGNIGLNVAHTGQTSVGSRVAPGEAIGGSTPITLLPVFGGTTFTRYLPSLNLKFLLPGDNQVRLGAARTMARPRFDYTNSSFGINTNVSGLTVTNPNLSYFSGSGGNAALLPTMADNYNLSLQHYFSGGGFACNGNEDKSSALCSSGGEGYVELTGYYIRLSDFINPNASTLFNFSPYESSYLTSAQQAELGTPYGILTIPDNDGTGHVEGEELATNVPLGDFTHWLSGVGVLASVDRTLSAVYYAGNTSPVTVPGLSKWVENYTLYYQFRGFQFNVSDSVQSSFLGEVFGLSATRIEQQVKGYSTVAAQVSYAFNSGALKGLTLIATGSNLTNSTFQTFNNGDPRQVVTWEEYGRLFTVGFSYNLF